MNIVRQFTLESEWSRRSPKTREAMNSNPIGRHTFFLLSFLINEYIYTYIEKNKKKKQKQKQKQKKKKHLPKHSACLSDEKSSGAFNHSRIRPAHRSISNPKYASLIWALIYD